VFIWLLFKSIHFLLPNFVFISPLRKKKKKSLWLWCFMDSYLFFSFVAWRRLLTAYIKFVSIKKNKFFRFRPFSICWIYVL